ncbi:WD40-repeat-containing domain protein [Hypoxylon argillaceum]|nr:WD40-repeat-containing domain protein [Hypoxylon argillaceum]
MFEEFEQWRIDAKVYDDRVEEIHHVSNALKGIRRRLQTQVWHVERSLGWGGFGEVRLEKDVDNGQLRAVKKITIATNGTLRGEDSDYERELRALIEFSKPKFKESAAFVEFYGWFTSQSTLYFAMEYAPFGDLDVYMESNPNGLKENDARDISEQILLALEMMHVESLYYFDMKPKNILIICESPSWWVKLCDFGLTQRDETVKRSFIRGGTQTYMSPEQLCLLNSESSFTAITGAADMWSAGCIIYLVATGLVPFPRGTSLIKYCEDITLFPYHTPLDPSRQSGVLELLRQLLQPLPQNRLTASEALAHTWFGAQSDQEGIADRESPATNDIPKKEMELVYLGKINCRISENMLDMSTTNLKASVADKDMATSDTKAGGVGEIPTVSKYGVGCMTVSPDNHLLALGSVDKIVHLWNLKTEREQVTLVGHQGGIMAVAFSPDQKFIASASRDHTIRTWNVASGEPCSILSKHTDSVFAVAYSQDGRLIASGSRDESVRIWNASSGAEIHVLRGHTDWVTAVEFSKVSNIIASASLDQKVRLWDAIRGRPIAVLTGLVNWVHPVIFSPYGQHVAPIRPDMTVRLGDPPVELIHGEYTTWFPIVIFSSDDDLVASVSRDKTIRLWNVHTGLSYGVMKLHMNETHAAMFSPDGAPATPDYLNETLPFWKKLLMVEDER